MAGVLKKYFNVNAFTADWVERLKNELHGNPDPQYESRFRQQLSEAISRGTITPLQYERLTGEDFDTPSDLRDWLLEVWRKLYGDEPILLD